MKLERRLQQKTGREEKRDVSFSKKLKPKIKEEGQQTSTTITIRKKKENRYTPTPMMNKEL